MGLVPSGLNLTTPDPGFESKRRATAPGMAHWAGSGPTGTTCRECAHWTGCGGEVGYYSKKGGGGGVIKPRKCAQYRKMMTEAGPGVPHETPSCKYFAVNATPPTITAK